MDDHLIVNSGIVEVYGEFDSDGRSIREYKYESDFQEYQVMKDDFSGVLFI